MIYYNYYMYFIKSRFTIIDKRWITLQVGSTRQCVYKLLYFNNSFSIVYFDTAKITYYLV